MCFFFCGEKSKLSKSRTTTTKTKFLSLLLSSSQSCSKKKRVDTRSQKDEKRRRTTTTPGGCLDATLKKRTDRRNRRHDFPELKFVQDGGFTGGIETNLRAFSARDKKNESLRSVHAREKFRKQPTNSYANAFHPFKTTDATPRRGEAADVPPHRISQNPKKKIPASFSSGRCPSTTFIRALRNSKSNPLPHHHHRECRSVRFDDESNPL